MAVKNGGLLLTIVIILVIVAGGYWYTKMYQKPDAGVVPMTELPIPTPIVKGQVFIEKNVFVPDSITVKVGDTVTWVNNETYGHDVTSDTGLFKSPTLATGEKYSFTFVHEGTYPYICAIHPFMHGTVIVTK